MFTSFTTSESGAVTVDWVVLTAGLVGLGLAVMAVVSAGVQDTSGDIQGQLERQRILSSFAQRTHSEYYDAVQDFLEAGFTTRNSVKQFETHTGYLPTATDQELLDFWSWAEAGRDTDAATLGHLQALDAQSVTSADLATALASNGLDVQAVEDAIANDHGGDAAEYLAYQTALTRMQIEFANIHEVEIDRRGIGG